MDDFGTGYSSLSYLRSFPFDKIKIDRTFVSDLDGGTENGVIVQAVIIIARALGMTHDRRRRRDGGQQRLLTALGCDEAQGYLFSRPVPIEQRARRHRQMVGREAGGEKTLRGVSGIAVLRRPSRVRDNLGHGSDAAVRRRCGAGLRCASCQSRNSPDATTMRRPDEQADRRHVAPGEEADHHRPHQHEIVERRHRGGRREPQRLRPEILPDRIGDAAQTQHRRRRAASASGSRTPAGRRADTASVAICHISSVLADSVLVMPRTATVTLPYITALASANSAPSWSESAPGLVTMRTPKNPISSAAQRTGPDRSLSQTIETSAENSGAEKLMAIAPASGIRL